MNGHDYTEEMLVEMPAIELMQDLGWDYYYAFHEFERGRNPNGTTFLGRETKSEVILKDRLRKALEKLNPTVPRQGIDEAIDEIAKGRSHMNPVAANREVYLLLKEGVRVNVPDPDGDGEVVEVVRVINWDCPDQNDFLLCSQFWVAGEMYTRRPDLVGFVNGIPLVLMELKATHKRLETAFTHNLRDYKDTIPQIFWSNALIILSNGSQSRVGSVSAGWEHFCEWKKVGSEKEESRVSLETMLKGVCEPSRLLDLVENFTLFQEVPGGMIKLAAKNHQYLGVNHALEAMDDIHLRDGKLGVFWHTQGSGKSVSMIFFAQKVMRKILGNWTFVVVTDRLDLDGQIYKNFASSGVITEGGARAESSQDLRRLLSEDHRYIFTLIHKFRTEPGQPHPVLSTRNDIIVITDEAHRSQYDTLALNMRMALPNASFLAFTGTPLIQGEERTRQVFGDYISIYNFLQSIEDGSTVPLFYENRIPGLQLVNENLNEDIASLLEAAALDEEQEDALARTFANEYHLITRNDRLEAIAKDMVEHFSTRGFLGKAMMVCIDKVTTVRMYDKVKRHWDQKIQDLEAALAQTKDEEYVKLHERITWMTDTDMAVVVSQSQNEIADMREKGLDFSKHRKRMQEEDLETRFKNPQDPFRLVFVCAMWITGFDVPSCSTLYLDKPMRNHTLMQTIARANRVYPEKVSGLIVDYVGVFRNLEKALAIYGAGGGSNAGARPVEDKTMLFTALKNALDETRTLCEANGVYLERIQASKGFSRIEQLDDAVEALIVSEEVKRKFLDLANLVYKLYKAMLPDPRAQNISGLVNPIKVVADKIRSLKAPIEISTAFQEMEQILDHAIATDGYVVGGVNRSFEPIDLSKINFEALEAEFKKSRKRTLNEKLKGTVARKVTDMVKKNRTRANFLERFQELIDDYNAGKLNAEEFFKRLMEFAKSLDQEEQRTVSENLTEEELAIFDLLTKPDVTLTYNERTRVKRVAQDLLNTLKREKLVLDWRKHQRTRADVQKTIEEVLDENLPTESYPQELFIQKTRAVFEHIYESYFGDGKSIYGTAA